MIGGGRGGGGGGGIIGDRLAWEVLLFPFKPGKQITFYMFQLLSNSPQASDWSYLWSYKAINKLTSNTRLNINREIDRTEMTVLDLLHLEE